MNIVIE